MTSRSFLTSHARVLLCIARDPGARLRDIAASRDITERSATIRPQLLCGRKTEALDCTVLHCPTWISAAGPVLTFRLTLCQNPRAETS